MNRPYPISLIYVLGITKIKFYSGLALLFLKMNKFYYPIICFLLFNYSFRANAQLSDDFSDGNFSVNPTWTGTDSLFKVNTNFELQAAGGIGTAAESYLGTQYILNKDLEWRFWLRFGFNPSTQNYVRVYLSANNNNPKNSNISYYLQFGGSTGSTDSLVLYKETNQSKTSLIRGRPGTLGKTINSIMLRVRRSNAGVWTMEMDTSNTGHYVLEGNATDTSTLTGNNFCLNYKYTSSNTQNLLFDALYIGTPYEDVNPPQLIHSEVQSDTSIQLEFNEKIEQPFKYQLLLNQYSAAKQMQWMDAKSLLVFYDQLPSDTLFCITLNQVKDLVGNSLDTTLFLKYHKLQKGDILLSEMMPDPDPSNGLPNAEFIEIYNTLNQNTKLRNLSISDGSGNYKLPEFTLNANEFVILCASKDSSLFKPYGRTIAANYFPSLNNSGDKIQLIEAQKTILDSLSYNLNWYYNKLKETGGWSLELVSPKQSCKGQSNWQASIAAIGGTPGKENSNWQINADTMAPLISSVNVINAAKIKVQLNEKPSFEKALIQSFQLTDNACKNVWLNPLNETEIIIELQDTLHHLEAYTLKMDKVYDCSGNALLQEYTFNYCAQIMPKQNDIIFNEIYYNMDKKGNIPNLPFIELYNRSDYSIQLENMKLSDAISQSSLPSYELKPKQYLLLCKETAVDSFIKYGEVLGLANFPYLNASDQLRLQDSLGYQIHQVNYQQNWFEPNAYFYACTLELIDPNNPCGKAENWQASQDKNGGTPGKTNSVFRNNKDLEAPQLMRIYVPKENLLELRFNEAIDSSSLGELKINENYIGKNFHYLNRELNHLQIELPFTLDSFETYQLHIDKTKDCALNSKVNTSSLPFQRPIAAKAQSLVINEILFNPISGDNDFIELYNTTKQTIDLSDLLLFTINESGERKDINAFAEDGYMIHPNEFLCIAADPTVLQKQHFGSNRNAIIPHALPALNDDDGILVLKNKMEETIDSFYFSEKMHLSFLNQKEGVSLERINPFMPSTEKSNWTSAAEDLGYSTPTSKNSVFNQVAAKGNFSCALPYFSPDGDGENDVMQFFYTCEKNGNVGKLAIYNQAGICIKNICAAKVLATNGEINWTGEDNNGNRAPIGLYVASWTIYNADGSNESVLKSFALLSK